MLIYLAARYSRLEELNGYAKDLRGIGHEVKARWLKGSHQLHKNADLVEAATQSVPIEGRPFAVDDYEDVCKADALIAFSEAPRQVGASRGGRHVEFGVALALGKRVIVVGPRENIFHTLPQVEHFWLWPSALDAFARCSDTTSDDSDLAWFAKTTRGAGLLSMKITWPDSWKKRKYELYHGNYWTTWHTLPEVILIRAVCIMFFLATVGLLGWYLWTEFLNHQR